MWGNLLGPNNNKGKLPWPLTVVQFACIRYRMTLFAYIVTFLFGLFCLKIIYGVNDFQLGIQPNNFKPARIQNK